MEKEMRELYYAQKPGVPSFKRIAKNGGNAARKANVPASSRKGHEKNSTKRASGSSPKSPAVHNKSAYCAPDRSIRQSAQATAASARSRRKNIPQPQASSNHAQTEPSSGPYSCLYSGPASSQNKKPPRAFDLTVCHNPTTMQTHCTFRLQELLGEFTLPSFQRDVQFPIAWTAGDPRSGQVGSGDGYLTIGQDGRFDGAINNLFSEEKKLHIWGKRSEKMEVPGTT